jgi:hypothetical protein
LDFHTFGYFTFDFVAAVTGLKYWLLEYFGFSRTPYLVSGYNTYTAFYWFYSDFGVPGLFHIPLVLGFSVALVYYRMRTMPTIKNIVAYAVMVFVMLISFFNFPMMNLWFESNVLLIYFVLRLTVPNRNTLPRAGFAPAVA